METALHPRHQTTAPVRMSETDQDQRSNGDYQHVQVPEGSIGEGGIRTGGMHAGSVVLYG